MQWVTPTRIKQTNAHHNTFKQLREPVTNYLADFFRYGGTTIHWSWLWLTLDSSFPVNSLELGWWQRWWYCCWWWRLCVTADHPLRPGLLGIHEQPCTSLPSSWGGGGGGVHEKLDQFLARLRARCLAYLAPSASFLVCAWGDLSQTQALIP